MALKVIGAGFGRTGTLSLKIALEQLGYGPCYHMLEITKDTKTKPDQWVAIANGESPDWDVVFEGYQAAVDWPAVSFYRELLSAYPEAKVILTTRSFDSWYQSTQQTIYSITKAMGGWLSLLAMPRKMEKIAQIAWQKDFHGQFEDRDYAQRIFEQHSLEVKSLVPANQLLEFQPQQGWQPLCDFLNVPIPQGDFPRVNDSREIRKRLHLFRAVRYGLPTLATLAAIATYFNYAG
jgi:hypothetical protein